MHILTKNLSNNLTSHKIIYGKDTNLDGQSNNVCYNVYCSEISRFSQIYLIFTAITSVTLGLHQRCSCLNIYSNQPN